MASCIARLSSRPGVRSPVGGPSTSSKDQQSPLAAFNHRTKRLLATSRLHAIGRGSVQCLFTSGLRDVRRYPGRLPGLPRAAADAAAEAPPSSSSSLTTAGAGRKSKSSRSKGKGKAASKAPTVLREVRWDDVGLTARVELRDGQFLVDLQLDPRPPQQPPSPSLVLHWGVDDWCSPPPSSRPPGTGQPGGDTGPCQTSFTQEGRLQLSFAQDECPYQLIFVLKQPAAAEAQAGDEVWYNNGGSNYVVPLRSPPLQSFMDKVLTAESSYSHWSLPQRLGLAAEVLDAAEAAGPPGMAFLFTWLRLSSTRVLDWYRGANLQPKDVAAIQAHAGERIAEKARSASHPLSRLFARGALAGLPRGGGNGDDIRMGILNIMRGHGIREGHRPGHDEPFLEQWHQKLHTNTSPDDVVICEAYLAFLHSGNHDDYWRVLWDNGRLTRGMMESWTKPIKAWPQHMPHLIPAFKHYLWILKTTHSGADLDTAMEMAKGHMDDHTRWMIYDILSHRHEWWVPGKIVEARTRLVQYWKSPGSSRDLQLLDIALEGWMRTCLERSLEGGMGRDDMVEVVALVLRGALLTLDDPDLHLCALLWERLRPHPAHPAGPLPGERWGREWALGARAAAERLGLGLTAHMDTVYGLVQPHAESFGRSCRLSPAHTANLGEEVVRGQPLFLAALLLQRLERGIREAAGGADWQIVSMPAPGSPPLTGEVVAVGALAEVQGAAFERPTVLLAGSLTGVEDIPAGVVAVLTRSSTDVLSHLAIRARSQRVLLATCFDEAAWQAWQAVAAPAPASPGANGQQQQQQEEGSATGAAPKRVAVLVDPAVSAIMPAEAPAAVQVTADGATAASASVAGSSDPRVVITLQAPQQTSAWALGESDFQPGLVGAKAMNLATLRRRLAEAPAAADGGGGGDADVISVPASVALPYGTFERVLSEEPRNAAAAAEVARLVSAAAAAAESGGLPRAELEELRRVVENDLVAPPDLVRQLAAVAAAQGLIPSADLWEDAAAAAAAASGNNEDEDENGAEEEEEQEEAFSTSGSEHASSTSAHLSWPAVWSAACRVWSSKWTERAWLSRRALGIREGQLVMSVLLQQVVPFQYAFVLHTSNPVTHKQGELLGEVVLGMGETLVGNYPGRALGFTAAAAGGGAGGAAGEPELLSLPSKRIALYAPAGATPTLIARSDANAEDLEQYAAAGLYDSVPLQPLLSRPTDYASEPLLSDPALRGALLGRLAGLGRRVAAAFGGRDQDVEGGVVGGRLYVVQARPQVAHK